MEVGQAIRTPSQTNAQIDFSDKDVNWALRLSPHYYNTKSEIDNAVEVLSGIM